MAVHQLNLDQAEAMVKGIDIPPRPTVLVQIMEEQEKPYPDIRRISEVISKDVSLSATVLKTVNSPFYGLRSKVTSIQQAAAILGINNIGNLVTGLALRASLGSKKRQVNLDDYWDAASNVALVSRQLSKHLLVGDPEQSYLLGLFHDCGIPLLLLKKEGYSEVLKEASANPDVPFTDIEERIVNTNHAVLGYFVAKGWLLPEVVRNCILVHHDIRALESDDLEQNNLLALLKVAEHITHTHNRISDDVEWEAYSALVLDFLSLDADELAELVEDYRDQLSSSG